MPFVNRCGDAPKLQTKTITPTTSQRTITPDTGYEGIDKVIVNAPALQTKTVTTDGTALPDGNYIGLSSVMVNVPYDLYITNARCSQLTKYMPDTNYERAYADSLSFYMGDSMDIHSTTPSKIIIHALKPYTDLFNYTMTVMYTNLGIYGCNLTRHSDTQYLGYLYRVQASNNVTYPGHYKYGGNDSGITQIIESDIQTTLGDTIVDASIGVTYNYETKLMTVSVERLNNSVTYPNSKYGFCAFIEEQYQSQLTGSNPIVIPEEERCIPYKVYCIWDNT